MKRREKIIRGQKKARAQRTRHHLRATSERPRLSVFRSLKHISGQIIDADGKVLAAASDLKMKKSKKTGMERAAEVGKMIAEKAMAKNIKEVVFDKGPYTYHGQVKAFADAAREGGLQF